MTIVSVSKRTFPLLAISIALASCNETAQLSVDAGIGPDPVLPPPNKALFIPTVNVAGAGEWASTATPQAAIGLKVTAFARDLEHPRWLYVLPNGDVLVAETNGPPRPDDADGVKGWIMNRLMSDAGAGVPSADQITILRDSNGDGEVDFQGVFLENLHSPFGMALVADTLYVANTDSLVEFPYTSGQTKIEQRGKVLTSLPGGPLNHHWTKNVIASPDGRNLYVAVGSNSNVAENGIAEEEGRAAIWEVDRASGEHRIYANGLRNPVGMTWVPESGKLWVAVNERDALGSDLVPDYMTSVQQDGFYGWPYSYYGQHVDDRVEPTNHELIDQAIVPDYALGPHTGSLGLTYAQSSNLPELYRNGMFVGQHGSWNREPRSGYKVIFIPFTGGEPSGQPIDVLTGFLDGDTANGRPVGVALDQQGDLLVADDVGNTVWHVTRN